MFNSSDFSFRPILAAVSVAALLSACGGSSSSPPPIPPKSSSSASSSSVSSEASSSSSSSSSSSEFIAVETDIRLFEQAEFPIGVAVSAANEPFSIFNNTDGSDRRDVIVRHFSELTAGNIMKMSYLHPQEDTYTFGDADELVNFAKSNGMKVHGHALVWHPNYQVPGFMNNYQGDWVAMLTEHVQTIVNHFDDTVVSWDVVNEAISDSPNQGDGWRQSLFYNALPPAVEGDIPEYIKVAFQAARDANPDIDLYYNDYDNTANPGRLNKTLEIAEALQAEGTIDGVGFQMHIYQTYPSISNFENAFQQVVDLGLKVKITELDIAVVNPYGSATPPALPEYNETLMGNQKLRYCQVTEVYLDTVPEAQRGGITVWGLADNESWLMNQFRNATGADYDDVWPLLFNADLTEKPALLGVAEALAGEPCTTDF
ncbi:MAG TPA: endo-1,4-beta-xylanase [Cellvibrionaceae bacterium]